MQQPARDRRISQVQAKCEEQYPQRWRRQRTTKQHGDVVGMASVFARNHRRESPGHDRMAHVEHDEL
jgi:hypothetical protein